jgi:phenylalanine-4-hydroxylase
MRRPSIREKVPAYLHAFIAEQDPKLYTAIDHASWRYIMRVSKAYFAEHAHQKYLDGLRETGISTERIPLISEMDEKLSEFGWRAVAVVGFIPPAVFMEFLSLGVLPIACDMRTLEHLSYTPAPDIVHEAAGHAPIIADQEYADYLFQYGEIARKVIFSDQDMNVYEAVRALSDIKEDPHATQEEIASTQRQLDEAAKNVTFVSEATLLARMSWWTIEYGLVGDMKNPKIYGAGLLSSVAESYHCLGAEVKKIPFTLDCINMTYDITRPQPQLYVTPDFANLREILDDLADTLAYRRGGLEGLEKARKSRTVTTTVFESGIQIGGLVEEVILDRAGAPCYLRFRGPCQLAVSDHELEGHDPKYHREGFGTALGKLKGFKKGPAEIAEGELRKLKGRLEFESGVTVEGELTKILRHEGKNVVLTFERCTVKLGDRVLFDPSWGTYDLACGANVVSVFGGPPDRGKYLAATGGFAQKPARQKTNLTKENAGLAKLYEKVRKVREGGGKDVSELERVHAELERDYPADWLLRMELLETKGPWAEAARKRLGEIAGTDKDKAELIARGLRSLA